MKLAYNPSDKPALTGVSSDNKDIIFDLSGIAIYARGVKFDGKTPTVFKKHTSANTGGYDGLVPAPSYANSATRFLREDGTWVIPDKTTSIHWDNIDGKPNVFNPSQHIHTTNDILSLTNYTKAIELKALTTSDTLNVALGKLEYKSDLGVTAYNWYKSVTDEDTDEHINKWNEIVSFLNGVTDTTLNGILNNFVNDLEVTGSGNAVTNVSKSNNKITVTKGNSFLPLSGGTMTGDIYFDYKFGRYTRIFFKDSRIYSSGYADNFIIFRDGDNKNVGSLGLYGDKSGVQYYYFGHNDYTGMNLRIYKDSVNWGAYALIHSGNIGSQSVASANRLQTPRTIWGQSFDGTGNVDGTIRINSQEDVFEAITIHNDWYTTDVFKYTDIRLLSYPSGTRGGVIRVGTGNYGMFNSMSFGKMESGDSYTPYIFIYSSGNVGIGTTSPSYKLDVNGAARASGFIKSGSSSAYVLTGDGGHKAISDFATAGSLGNYLPLAGGTMNSTAYIAWNNGTDGNDLSDWNITNNGLRIISSVTTTSNAPTQYSTALHVRGRYGFQLAGLGGSTSNTFYIKNIHNTIWNTLIHSNNYNNYTVTKTGSGASGTWGINISGNAATATNADKLDGYHYNNLPYLPLAGGTMNLGEGLKFHADENYFGTNLDARIISLLDGNGTTCDGGLIIDERCTSNGTTTITELLRIRDSEFKWKGLNILHSGNYSSYLGYIGTTAVQSTSAALALTGITTATFSGAVTLSGTASSTAILKFSRSGVAAWNYIIWPGDTNTDCKLAFGYSNSSAASYYYMTSASFNPVADNVRSLGTSSVRWSNVYSVLGNFSGLITATSGVLIGSTADIGWYLSNSRISAGKSTARGVNVGSLLVSNAWADYTKVPTDGIYSKGDITTAGTMSSANYLIGTALELKTDDTTCQTTVFGSNSSGYRMRIVRLATSTNLNTLYSPTLVLSSLDTHAYIAWSYYSDSVWVGGGYGNKWNWRSKLVTSTNYGSYLGYIGTTAVQSSSKTQELTGITNATMSGTTTTKNLVVSGANQYRKAGGIILYNSDIWGINAIYTLDLANAATEGYLFKRTNGNYDSLWCKDGVFYFSPNGNSDSGYSSNYPVIVSVHDSNGFPALLRGDGSSNWIRISNSSSYGLLPNQSGGAGSGHGYLGTSSWYFKYAYIDQIYGYLNGNISGSASYASNADTVDGKHASAFHLANAKISRGGGSYKWYSVLQYNASNANPSYYSADCAIINITSYTGWQPWIRAVDSENGSWTIGQYTTNLHIGYIPKTNTVNTLTYRWDFGKDGYTYLPSKTWIGTTSGNEMLNVGGNISVVYNSYPGLTIHNNTTSGESSIYVKNNTAGWALGVNTWGLGAGLFAIGLYSGTGSSSWRFRIDNNGYCYTNSYLNIGGHEKNASSPTYVWGSNSSDTFLRSYQTSKLSVNYANSAGSATYASYLNILDVRKATRSPNYFVGKCLTAWFNNTGTPDSNWYSGIHMKGWSNGYASWELCSYSGTSTANNFGLYFRNGNNDTWGSWKLVAFTNGYHIAVTTSAGTDSSTIYFVI